MKKLLLMVALLGPTFAFADTDTYFVAGPLQLTIPLKTAAVTYMFDFNADQNLVGAETTIARVWDRVEGTVGGVTSLEGQGAPFVGGNILIGNLVDRWVTLPPDLNIGGFGGYNFQAEHPIYGLKASYKLW